MGYLYGEGKLIGVDGVDFRTGMWFNYTILDIRLGRLIVPSCHERGEMVFLLYVADGT